mmetsp:Transcript_1184/g.2301  ORF Transcript_1184/g.2301 Transcript_1184/m.2301 type:complete len:206 (+) Transcript_1184:939-1556(+)
MTAAIAILHSYNSMRISFPSLPIAIDAPMTPFRHKLRRRIFENRVQIFIAHQHRIFVYAFMLIEKRCKLRVQFTPFRSWRRRCHINIIIILLLILFRVIAIVNVIVIENGRQMCATEFERLTPRIFLIVLPHQPIFVALQDMFHRRRKQLSVRRNRWQHRIHNLGVFLEEPFLQLWRKFRQCRNLWSCLHGKLHLVRFNKNQRLH